MARKNFTYTSANGATKVNAYIWVPNTAPKAILQVSHGMAEEALRYDELASFLNNHQILVCANDHLGHGKSLIKDEELLTHKNDEGYKKVVEDIKTLHDIVSDEYPGIPYFILGFSLGSFLLRSFLIKYSNLVDGAIIMGTGNKAQAVSASSKVFSKIYKRFIVGKKTKPINKIGDKLLKRKLKKAEKKFEWLIEDDETKAEYLNSNMRNFMLTIDEYFNIFALFKEIRKRKNLEMIRKDLPVYFLSGKDDIVGNFGKSVTSIYNKYIKIGMRNVKIKLYDNVRHTILISDKKLEAMNDILLWLQDK